ncbi:MAG TPA: glycine/sarcosine/betaine reductase selenoprotein B family protein [Terriglobia bacterium]|nr:glycine/sarcosine/betaine reductase selenoprotein B family protein [Terriglobia bacterium]
MKSTLFDEFVPTMARLEDLQLSHRLFVEAYPFRTSDWAPGARLTKPLSQSKLALISSAGLHLPAQLPFDLEMRGGDVSFRELPGTLDVRDLRISQRSSDFDQTGAREDSNLVFPLDRFRELLERGEIASLNHRHFSFMGSVTAPGRLLSDSAPRVAEMLREDRVDAAFLVPA